MRTIAIVNQKGGSGKTTTAVNLAAAMGEKKRKILLIDLDPQASASAWYGISDGDRDLLDVFTGDRDLLSAVRDTDSPDVQIIPASTWLVGAEKALAAEVGAETILHKAIGGLPADRWDYILMDCPPQLGLLTVNALSAAGEVMVPVEAHVMALAGLAQLVQTVDVVRERLNGALGISGILACRVDLRTRHAQDVLQQLRDHFGELVYQTIIRENIRLAEAPSFAQPITEYDRGSRGAEDYLSLAKEVMGQEGA